MTQWTENNETGQRPVGKVRKPSPKKKVLPKKYTENICSRMSKGWLEVMS